MKRDIQNIRESQFVLVYGPGSLIESKNGSRLIPNIKHCLGNRRYRNDFLGLNEFKEEVRIRNIVKKEEKNDKIHLYSIPSNAAQGLSNFKGSYRTSIFPTWHVCHNKKHGEVSILYDSSVSPHKCPVCDKDKYSSSVRFVLACPEGHLDEVDWDYAVHHKNNCNPNCSPEYYIWKPKGTGYSEIFVQCPICKAERSIAEIFNDINFLCTERQPENENPDIFVNNVFYSKRDIKPEEERNKKHYMRIVQRQSTSLRVAKTLTVLKIPKYKREIVKLIESYDQIQEQLLNSEDETYFLDTLQRKKDQSDYLVAKKYFEEFPDYEEFKTLVSEIFSDFEKALDVEFDTLNLDEPILDDDDLIKQRFEEYNLKIFKKQFPLKVCAIDRLTTVTTQLSYQRLPTFDNVDPKTHELKPDPKLSSAFRDEDGEYWYPAYEGVGEGIFITSDKNPLKELDLDKIADKWENHIRDDIILNLKRQEIKDPLFVWWHTLSHALINSLSLSCGYNSTALRERVYIKNGKAGILIYNTSPGEDSGMGGLSDTVYSFDIILKNAMNSLKHCANDPLCLNRDVKDNGVNGAACHNCLLISETSCEHRNILLDRHFFTD